MAAMLILLYEPSQTHCKLKMGVMCLIAPSSWRSSAQFPAKQILEEDFRGETAINPIRHAQEVVTIGHRSATPGSGQTSIVLAEGVPAAQRGTMG